MPNSYVKKPVNEWHVDYKNHIYADLNEKERTEAKGGEVSISTNTGEGKDVTEMTDDMSITEGIEEESVRDYITAEKMAAANMQTFQQTDTPSVSSQSARKIVEAEAPKNVKFIDTTGEIGNILSPRMFGNTPKATPSNIFRGAVPEKVVKEREEVPKKRMLAKHEKLMS